VPCAGAWRRWRRLPLRIPDWEGFKLGWMGGKGSINEWEWELEFGVNFGLVVCSTYDTVYSGLIYSRLPDLRKTACYCIGQKLAGAPESL